MKSLTQGKLKGLLFSFLFLLLFLLLLLLLFLFFFSSSSVVLYSSSFQFSPPSGVRRWWGPNKKSPSWSLPGFIHCFLNIHALCFYVFHNIIHPCFCWFSSVSSPIYLAMWCHHIANLDYIAAFWLADVNWKWQHTRAACHAWGRHVHSPGRRHGWRRPRSGAYHQSCTSFGELSNLWKHSGVFRLGFLCVWLTFQSLMI